MSGTAKERPGKPVKLVAAVGANGVIGAGNALPWKSREDLARFARLTMGGAVVMGRKTYESIGRPLRGRMTVVLSKDPGLRLPGCEARTSLADAMAAAAERPAREVWVAGGGEIYRQTMDLADELHVTHFELEDDGDTHFPQIDPGSWRIVHIEAGETSPSHEYRVYRRGRIDETR